MTSTRKYAGAVAWDFDGVINDIIALLAKGKQPHEVEISDVPYLLTVFKILEANNILSVLVSQRINYDPNKEEGKWRQWMLAALDKHLGKDRTFLTEAHAKIIGHVDNRDNTDKNATLALIKKIPGCEQLENSDITLIDDNRVKYKAPTEKAGYHFIHAPRDDVKGSKKDCQHLVEVLVKYIPGDKIFAEIKNFAPDKEKEFSFYTQILEYKNEQLEKVIQQQSGMLGKRR